MSVDFFMTEEEYGQLSPWHPISDDRVEIIVTACILDSVMPTDFIDAYCDAMGLYGRQREYVRDEVFGKYEQRKRLLDLTK